MALVAVYRCVAEKKDSTGIIERKKDYWGGSAHGASSPCHTITTTTRLFRINKKRKEEGRRNRHGRC